MCFDQLEIRSDLRMKHSASIKSHAEILEDSLSEDMRRSVELARQKGASNWLTTLPITEHGFSRHKSAFRDALALRYGWQPSRLPLECVCGSAFSVEHALNCARGGLPSQCHNELRGLTAQLLSEVCYDVKTEPDLQPLTGERMNYRSAITTEEARLDVRAQGFWARSEKAYFDVKVFNPFAKSYRDKSIPSLFFQIEQLKQIL